MGREQLSKYRIKRGIVIGERDVVRDVDVEKKKGWGVESKVKQVHEDGFWFF